MPRGVLLIDSDIDALGALASDLRSRGLSVVLADGPVSALDRAHRTHVDAVLVAEHMARGSDVLPRLRADHRLNGLPCYLLVDREPAAGELPRGDPEVVAQELYGLPSKAPDAADSGDFRGDVQQVSIADLLQLLSMNRRTGSLSLTTANGAGEVQLVEGEVADAFFRRLEGTKALLRLLAEEEGSFTFVASDGSVPRRIQEPTRLLLMDGMRQIDEARRARSLIAGEDDALHVPEPPREARNAIERRVLDVLASPRSLDEVLDELPYDDLAILETVKDMMQQRIIHRLPRASLRVQLASSDELNIVQALLRRIRKPGFTGHPRLVLAAQASVLGMVSERLGRLAEASAPTSRGSALVPHLMVTLHFSENAELEIAGLPLVERFSPCWRLALPGISAVVMLGGEPPVNLKSAVQAANVRLLAAEELVGPLDPTSLTQLAQMLRAALEAMAEP